MLSSKMATAKCVRAYAQELLLEQLRWHYEKDVTFFSSPTIFSVLFLALSNPWITIESSVNHVKRTRAPETDYCFNLEIYRIIFFFITCIWTFYIYPKSMLSHSLFSLNVKHYYLQKCAVDEFAVIVVSSDCTNRNVNILDSLTCNLQVD